VDPADPEALAVNDGGLVILWPFLRVLFQRSMRHGMVMPSSNTNQLV
jgi:hypothetical protein